MEHTTESDEKKRSYHSRVRQRQAEETHRRILAAAGSLFASHGYAETTLEAIAETAEVSPKTIAAVFGSKRALLAAVINPEAFSSLSRNCVRPRTPHGDSRWWLRSPARLTSRWQAHWNCCGRPEPWPPNWRIWRNVQTWDLDRC